MIIESIKIENFRGIEYLEIPALDEHINLFVGVNGAGKTSVLGSPRRPLASSQRQIRKLLIIFCKNYIKFKKHSANLQHFLAFFLKI